MKRLIPLLILIAGVASARTTSVGRADSLASQRAACNLKHGHLMEKAAGKNEQACWSVHAYLLDRQ